MPSFAATLQDEQIWKIAMFLKRMDMLPPTVDAERKKHSALRPLRHRNNTKTTLGRRAKQIFRC
jgi:hypothetical protein